jgi:hypothetical protein
MRIPGFDDQKLKKKNTAEIIFFISKIVIYLSLGLIKGRPSYRKKPSALKREHPALHLFFFNSESFSFFPVILYRFSSPKNPFI